MRRSVGGVVPEFVVGALPGAYSIRRLNLTDFRNYGFLRLETDGRPVVLIGQNGAGKTNILESISYLVPGRGIRSARLSEVGRVPDEPCVGSGRGSTVGGGSWAVAGSVSCQDQINEIGTGFAPDTEEVARERRVIRINGKNLSRQSDLGNFNSAVWLTPLMDRLFVDSASGRRRFVDRLILGFDSDHVARVSSYERSMRGRNKLLKEGNKEDEWLSSLEDAMARYGVAIAARRKEAVTIINQLTMTEEDPFPSAHVTMGGDLERWLDQFSALDVEERLRRSLASSRSIDSRTGSAMTGPHKSDLTTYHIPSGTEARICSTGEQKALLVRLILAATSFQAMERGRTPVLLLDEIGAHLDNVRRSALCNMIVEMGVQAWMTGTEEALFESIGTKAQCFKVMGAKVEKINLG